MNSLGYLSHVGVLLGNNFLNRARRIWCGIIVCDDKFGNFRGKICKVKQKRQKSWVGVLGVKRVPELQGILVVMQICRVLVVQKPKVSVGMGAQDKNLENGQKRQMGLYRGDDRRGV